MAATSTLDDLTRCRLARLEAVARAAGRDAEQARAWVAARLGCSPGALEGVRRGRTKGVKAWLAERVRSAFCEILAREMKALEHELAMAEAGNRLLVEDAEQAARLIEQARGLIGGKG